MVFAGDAGMKRILTILLSMGLLCMATQALAQHISDAGYRTVGHIKDDGTIQDNSYRTVGHIKSDGTVQDASYRTIGHAKGIPLYWAAFYFFFRG